MIKKLKVAIVGCVHGDELIGEEVGQMIVSLNFNNIDLSYLTANGSAKSKGKRFIDRDLNRSFYKDDVKSNDCEISIAKEIKKNLQDVDLVLDIHSTKSKVGKFIILVNDDEIHRKFVSFFPTEKVVIMDEKMGKNSLIANCGKIGISIEYEKDKNAYLTALEDIKTFLFYLNDQENQNNFIMNNQQYYKVFDTFNVLDGFSPSEGLKEFDLIKRGQIVGYTKNSMIISNKNFYPIFLYDGAYKGTLSLMAEKI